VHHSYKEVQRRTSYTFLAYFLNISKITFSKVKLLIPSWIYFCNQLKIFFLIDQLRPFIAIRFDNTLNAIPSHDLLLFQLAISAKYSVSTSAPFTVRSGSGSWQDFVIIHDYVKSRNLSTAAGDDLIVLIKALCNNQSYPINLPRNMRTILDAIKKCMGDIDSHI
jgi:hypothetical protein